MNSPPSNPPLGPPPPSPALLAEIARVHADAELLHDAAAVEAALARMAGEIAARLAERTPLVLTVPMGGIVPTGLLLPRLDFPLELDYCHASRYRGQTSGADLTWVRRPPEAVRGRSCLLIDDVLDEGLTLAALVAACQAAGAKEVLTAVLVEKRLARKPGGLAHADFVGLLADDRYLYGLGMDYKHFLRNAPGIYAVRRPEERRP
jgi:hypoxanthine phosphoribosyltransferase